MRAYVVEEAGGPFVRVDRPTPAAKAGDVLVRVRASGVNPLDTKIRAGQAAHAKHPFPAIIGLDMAGVVEGVGTGVERFQPGDEVYGMVGGVGGIQGTLAEYVSVPQALLAKKPAELTMRQAAALPLITITAWEGIVDRANVRAGQSVLVHAGAGGVGHIAVQIAKARGATVYATVSPSKRAIVEGFGAVPIDYTKLVPAEYMAQYTDGAGFDIVYDTVGGSTIDASFGVVKLYTGHVVSCLGWSTHSLAPLSFRGATYSGVFTLLPLLSGIGHERHGQILAEAARLVDDGKLIPLLNERVYSVDDLADAHAAVAAGATGKVVIDL
jgi:NADPH:quinone reductase-like Zn-dependent oxidoreductase